MDPIKFPEHNTVYAEDQPEYQPLPALRRHTHGEVITLWQLTDEEKAIIAKSGQLWLSCWTFGQKLQPIKPSVYKSDFFRGSIDPIDKSNTVTVTKKQEDTPDMFTEMRAAGSKLPDIVDHLQANGWETYEHHDNWVRKEWTLEEKKRSYFSTHAAYERCISGITKPLPLDLTKQVFEALGAASSCWENLAGAGQFDSLRAKKIGDNLMQVIESDVPNAVKSLTAALAKEPGFYFAYQSNIAMAFVDAFNQYNLPSNPISQEMLKDIANIAAKQFLYLFIRESHKNTTERNMTFLLDENDYIKVDAVDHKIPNQPSGELQYWKCPRCNNCMILFRQSYCGGCGSKLKFVNVKP